MWLQATSSSLQQSLCVWVWPPNEERPTRRPRLEALLHPLYSSHVPVPIPTALGCWLLATHRRLVRWKCRLSGAMDPAYIILVPAFCKGAPTSCRKSEKNLKMLASPLQISMAIKIQPCKMRYHAVKHRHCVCHGPVGPQQQYLQLELGVARFSTSPSDGSLRNWQTRLVHDDHPTFIALWASCFVAVHNSSTRWRKSRNRLIQLDIDTTWAHNLVKCTHEDHILHKDGNEHMRKQQGWGLKQKIISGETVVFEKAYDTQVYLQFDWRRAIMSSHTVNEHVHGYITRTLYWGCWPNHEL